MEIKYETNVKEEQSFLDLKLKETWDLFLSHE